jgi:hypothetical protein
MTSYCGGIVLKLLLCLSFAKEIGFMVMYQAKKGNRSRKFSILFHVILLLTLSTSQLSSVFLPAYATSSSIFRGNHASQNTSSILVAQLPDIGKFVVETVQTVGDFLSLGANTAREAQEAARVAGDESRETLDQFSNDLEALVKTVGEQYKDNLDVTIASLDEFTRKKIEDLTNRIVQINGLLQDNIKLASRETQNIIRTTVRTTGEEVRETTKQLEESFKNVMIVGIEGAAYVVDRTTNNSIVFLSLGMLAVGLLFFIVLLVKSTLPSGLAVRILAFTLGLLYLIIFGSMAFLSPVRAQAMSYSGIGLNQNLLKYKKSTRDDDDIKIMQRAKEERARKLAAVKEQEKPSIARKQKMLEWDKYYGRCRMLGNYDSVTTLRDFISSGGSMKSQRLPVEKTYQEYFDKIWRESGTPPAKCLPFQKFQR